MRSVDLVRGRIAWGVRAAPFVALLCVAAACGGGGGDGGTPPKEQTPTTVALIGNTQTGIAGAALPMPVGVTVLDQDGDPIKGLSVGFAVFAGGGHVAASSVSTNASGQATTTWTVGTVAGPGNNSLFVTVPTYAGPQATLTASVIAGPPALLSIQSGDGQVTPTNTSVAFALAVNVRDAYSNSVAGATVTWSVGPGGGSVSAASTVSDATGRASVTRVTGATAGPQTTTATVAGTVPGSVTFTTTVYVPVSAYNPTFQFLTTVSPAQLAAFDSAARRWSSVIVGDLPDITVNVPSGTFCGSTYPAVDQTIDDLLIFVSIVPIDGVGGVLGSAGPCAYRLSGGSPTKLSVVGAMRLDAADLGQMQTNGTLTAVILHEMGHVIGFGSLWTIDPSLLVGGGGPDPYFSGGNAQTQFMASGGGVYAGQPVPVENLGPVGTRDSHWRESVMGKELMTGYVSLVANPLSVITVGSMQDMGYAVNYASADPYTVDGTNLRVPGPADEFKLQEAAPGWTVVGVDAQGRLARPRR